LNTSKKSRHVSGLTRQKKSNEVAGIEDLQGMRLKREGI